MSWQNPPQKSSAFDVALESLELGALSYIFRHEPAQQATRLEARIKLAAKLLTRVTELQQTKALEAVSQAVRFQNWHQLSAHLARAEANKQVQLPEAWFDGLCGALLLMVVPQDDVAMPEVQLEAFERFGQALTMLTDAPFQHVLDGVCAGMCAGKTWSDVLGRSPLKATQPLYRFVLPDAEMDSEEGGGYFDDSPACQALTEALDEIWQGYDDFPKPQKRKARAWAEDVLASQPGFLEGGLSLAWMQQEAGQAEASSTANRFIRQAEALIPAGYKGTITWSHIGNRFYHRLLWLRLKLHHEGGDLPSAAKVARKQLKLNPGDNLGVRYVLPLLLLEQGDYVAARRAAVKHLEGEWEHTAAAIKAFSDFALDNHVMFRRNLAAALISLPWLRQFLLNQSKPLPDGDDGSRGMLPDLELFSEFAWPAYVAVPGLRKACSDFLAEPLVLRAEAELRQYWHGFWRKGAEAKDALQGWRELAESWIGRLEEPTYEAALRLVAAGGTGPEVALLSRRREREREQLN